MHKETNGRDSASQSARRLDIQGLRAVAVLLVVAFHAGLPAPGGFVGVDVFFVISGFVITSMLQREWDAAGRLDLRRFYVRRFKRLAPALTLVLTFAVILSTFLLSPFGTQQTVAKTAIGGALFLANAVIARTTGGYFDAPAGTNPLLNIWSLSVEEQFYLMFPTIIALGWMFAKRVKPSSPVAILVVGSVATVSLCLAILGSSALGSTLPYRPIVGFYSPLTRSWEFAGGALLALAAPGKIFAWRHLATSTGILGLLLLAVSVWAISHATPFPSAWTILPVAATLLLILAGLGESNLVSRALSVKPMVKIGDWSYSIYLWHWPFIVFAKLSWPDTPWMPLVAATASFLPAILSYKWVEQPIRSHRKFSAPQFSLLVLVTTGPPLLLAAGLWQATRTMFWHEPTEAVASKATMPTGWRHPMCISKIPVNKRDIAQCKWQNDPRKEPIYLVGDSNAMHFSNALINAASTLHRPLTALGSDGCPLIDVTFRLKGDPDFKSRCRNDYTAMMSWLKSSPPGLVIIGFVDRYWRDKNYEVGEHTDNGDVYTQSTSKALDSGLTRTVEQLQKAGHQVLLLQTIPQYVEPPYIAGTLDCNGWKAIRNSCRWTSRMPLDFANQLQQASRKGVLSAAAKTGASVLDFRTYFCPDSECSTQINGIDTYMPDGYHLNKRGSSALSETFIQAINSASRFKKTSIQPPAKNGS